MELLAEHWPAVLFCLSAAALLYTWVGYPLLLALWARLRRRPAPEPEFGRDLPAVSVLIAAYNEEHTIVRKLRNCLSLPYPCDRLEVVVAADGCSDATEAMVRLFSPPVRLLSFPVRQGKAATLNDAIPACRGEIVVLTDAEELLEAGAVQALVGAFAADVGAVSGVVRFAHPASAVGTGAGLYWRLEQFVRSKESELHSMLGAAGCIYAVRRQAFRPIPPDTVSEDAFIPLDLIRRGWRVVHAPSAVACGERDGDAGREFRRKTRTTGGTWQFLWRQRALLRPGSGVAWPMWSHYLLRHLCPLFMLGALLGAAAGATRSPWLAAALGAQLAFYAAGAAGHWFEKHRRAGGWLLLPYYFCLAYVADIVGLVKLACGRQQVRWQRN